MAATIVPVTFAFQNPDGTYPSGNVLFKLNTPFSNGGIVYRQKTFTVQLDGTGSGSQNLAANNDAASTPQGTYYTVTEQISEEPEREYTISVSYLGAAQNITGVTTANPSVITVPNHGFSSGQVVTIANVGGATQADGQWAVTVLSVNTFSIPANVTGSYTSGGTVKLYQDLSVLMPNTSYGIGGS